MLRFHRLYTGDESDVWATIGGWGNRTVNIGTFHEDDIEAPLHWSDTAVGICASKYFRGKPGGKNREKSVKAMISRVANTISNWGVADGYFDGENGANFNLELKYILLHGLASFNSPVWFNVGVEEKPQTSACFILGVDDSMESIFEWISTEARIFKYGSGAGVNISNLRGSKEELSTGGCASGPLSFMLAADASAGVIKSGGKTRRSAKMVVMDVDHPDILEFIDAKLKAEKRAASLGDTGAIWDIDGSDGFILPYSNSNHAVRLTNEFMECAADNNWWYPIRRTDGLQDNPIPAGDILRAIATAVHGCGDPGVQFSDTINEWHTCPVAGHIRASNPCSELMAVDNSACNLASIRLTGFYDGDDWDYEAFEHVVRVMITAQDILIDRSSYPTSEIQKVTTLMRPLGLGFTDLGGLLMMMGLPYDSNDGRNVASTIASHMTASAYDQSYNMALAKSAFDRWYAHSLGMGAVIDRHESYNSNIQAPVGMDKTVARASDIWKSLTDGTIKKFRNSQVTLLAPTGTISFMMDCSTTGIEPAFSLVARKKLAGSGEILLVNECVEYGLSKLGCSQSAIKDIMFHIKNGEPIVNTNVLSEEEKRVFDCAMPHPGTSVYIHPQAHLDMMAAVQPFISGAISKTVNLPNTATVEEIENMIIYAWEKGLKAVTFYRDGCKVSQPLSVEGKKEAEVITNDSGVAMRQCMPKNCQSVRHKFAIGGLEGYLHVGLYEDGKPGEIFTTISKEGSTIAGLMDTIATLTSLALQYGVPLESLVDKFSHVRFEPSGMTGNADIPMATSIIDYIYRYLGTNFLSEQVQKDIGLRNGNGNGNGKDAYRELDGHGGDVAISDANICSDCGGILQRSGSCLTCPACGANTGCG